MEALDARNSGSLCPVWSLILSIQVIIQQLLPHLDVFESKDADPMITVDHDDLGPTIWFSAAEKLTSEFIVSMASLFSAGQEKFGYVT